MKLARVLHVPSRKQFAGIFTKGLPVPVALFIDFRASLHVTGDDQTEGPDVSIAISSRVHASVHVIIS